MHIVIINEIFKSALKFWSSANTKFPNPKNFSKCEPPLWDSYITLEGSGMFLSLWFHLSTNSIDKF